MKFSEAFEHYQQLVLASQSPREIKTELGRWQNHLAPMLADVPLEKSEICKFCNSKNRSK